MSYAGFVFWIELGDFGLRGIYSFIFIIWSFFFKACCVEWWIFWVLVVVFFYFKRGS